jgi:glycosyltransferase involved in cell wall biosynthesis
MPATERSHQRAQALPLVSIVTPAFNAAPTIERAIQSVLAQDYPHIEHWIVDGASTDATLSILECYLGRVTWLSEPDGGQSHALNKGFVLARGEIIGWLNADDVYYPGAVSRAVTYLLAHPEVAVIYSDFDFIDGHGQRINRIVARDFSPDKLLFANIVPQVTMFFSRRLLEDVGCVSTDYDFVMDWEFVLRAARRHRIQRIPGVGGGFRLVAGTKSVERSSQFWPEVISMLERSSFVQELVSPETLAEARRRAHLYAGVEFVRAGATQAAQAEFEAGLADLDAGDVASVSRMLPGILSTVVYPWHAGGLESPGADLCLENLCRTLPDTQTGHHLASLLRLYLGCRALKRFKPVLAIRHWRRVPRGWREFGRDLRYLPAAFLTSVRS